MGRKATVVRTETTTDDEKEGGEELQKHLDVALFSNLGDTEDTSIDKVHVLRMEPDEGYLGYLEATATEYDVFQRWGGSKFALEAKNERGRIVTRRTLKLAGDPVFMSEVFEARWRKSNGLKPKKAETSERDGGEFSAKELMALMETKLAAERVDAETREEKRRREDADRDAKARQDEREWRERMEKDKAEREARARQEEREHRERLEKEKADRDARLEAQRRDDDKRREDRIREDEQRREKDHERQMQASQAAAKESQEKNQQFFTNMLAMAKAGDKASADPMAQVTQILTIVEALKGAGGNGEPQDAVTTLLARLPETLQAAGSMVGDAIREAKGLPKGQANGESENEDGPAEPGAIKLTGEAAKKVRELVMHLVSKGQDPEKVLVAVADHLMGKRNGAAKALEAGKKNAQAAQVNGKSKAKRRRVKPKAARTASPPAPKAPAAASPPVPGRPAPLGKPAGAP